MDSRVVHIDNAKAIGMFLIVISHVWTTKYFSECHSFRVWDMMLNSFYVPLFFLLSGVFESSDNSLNKYIGRLIKLLKYIIIFIVIGTIEGLIFRHNFDLSLSFKFTLVWFLIALFIISLIFGIIKIFNRYVLLLFITITAVIGYILARSNHSYFYLGQALLCLPFYSFGYLKKEWLKNDKFNYKTFCFCLTTWIASLCFYKSPQNISVNIVSQSFVTFYLSAFSGSIVLIEISKLTKYIKTPVVNILSWYGRNTIVPMLTQMLIIALISKICIASNWPQYMIISIITIYFTFVTIPIFRNCLYDIFK